MDKLSVKIADIEQELKTLGELNKKQNKVKACLFNLILFSQNEERKEYLTKIVSSIIKKFPCRIIFIQHSPSFLNDLEIFVSSESSENEPVACDQITIKVSGNFIDRVPYLISPLLETDLPIYLFWGQDPTNETRILSTVQSFATRLIFDTEVIDDLQKFSEKMLHLILESNIELVDIQWVKCNVWRNVFIEVFDTEQRIKQLEKASQIKIEINKPKTKCNYHCEIQSLYLQAWLASRMKWTFQSIEHSCSQTKISYTTSKGHIDFLLTYGFNSDRSPGSILAIEIEGGDHLEVSILRQKIQSTVVLHICEENTCLLPYTISLPDLSEGFNFFKEIFYEPASLQYQEMLQQLIHLDWNKIKNTDEDK